MNLILIFHTYVGIWSSVFFNYNTYTIEGYPQKAILLTKKNSGKTGSTADPIPKEQEDSEAKTEDSSIINNIMSLKPLDPEAGESKILMERAPLNDNDFGHYLAGLIESDGHISRNSIIICFYILDLTLAKYIVTRLGFGTIRPIKEKRAIILTLNGAKNLETIIYLINGKIRTERKYNQLVKLINNSNLSKLITLKNINLKRNSSNDLDNYWISGFAEGDASFQIKVVNRANRIKPEIRLRFQADQKTNPILLLLSCGETNLTAI